MVYLPPGIKPLPDFTLLVDTYNASKECDIEVSNVLELQIGRCLLDAYQRSRNVENSSENVRHGVGK